MTNDTKKLLPKYPDLMERFERVDVLILHELGVMGFSPADAAALISVTLTTFAAGVQVRDDDGAGHDFVDNAKRGSAMAYAMAWLLLSGGDPGGMMARPPVRDCKHPLAAQLQDQMTLACHRRFDIEPLELVGMLANLDFTLLMIGGAVWCGGRAVGVPPHCPDCARNVIKITDAQRLAGAAVLLAWALYHEAMGLIGRELVRRELAAGKKNEPPAASHGIVWN